MKKHWLMSFVLLSILLPARAATTYTYSGPAYSIPDGNPSGVVSGVTVSGAAPVLVDVIVSLNLSGGYNGDLYAYLSYGGALVPLLNRVGVSSGNPFGYDGAGMNVLLSDSAAGSIHAAGNGLLTGTYRADGQNSNPLSGAGSFNANGGTITLAGTFANLNPNGNWTLFLADVISSGSPSLVNSWSLQLTAIPEPDVMRLGLAAIGAFFLRRMGGICSPARKSSETLIETPVGN